MTVINCVILKCIAYDSICIEINYYKRYTDFVWTMQALISTHHIVTIMWFHVTVHKVIHYIISILTALFHIYIINDLGTPYPTINYIHAITIYYFTNDAHDSTRQLAIDNAINWSMMNKMKINAYKTKGGWAQQHTHVAWTRGIETVHNKVSIHLFPYHSSNCRGHD